MNFFKLVKNDVLFGKVKLTPIYKLTKENYFTLRAYNISNAEHLFSEAKARVLGPGDLHVKAGSSVTLVCVINQGPHDLGTVFWYLGANMLQTTPTHPNDADTSARITIQVIFLYFIK